MRCPSPASELARDPLHRPLLRRARRRRGSPARRASTRAGARSPRRARPRERRAAPRYAHGYVRFGPGEPPGLSRCWSPQRRCRSPRARGRVAGAPGDRVGTDALFAREPASSTWRSATRSCGPARVPGQCRSSRGSRSRSQHVPELGEPYSSVSTSTTTTCATSLYLHAQDVRPSTAAVLPAGGRERRVPRASRAKAGGSVWRAPSATRRSSATARARSSSRSSARAARGPSSTSLRRYGSRADPAGTARACGGLPAPAPPARERRGVFPPARAGQLRALLLDLSRRHPPGYFFWSRSPRARLASPPAAGRRSRCSRCALPESAQVPAQVR
jgi:hypothetical protein